VGSSARISDGLVTIARRRRRAVLAAESSEGDDAVAWPCPWSRAPLRPAGGARRVDACICQGKFDICEGAGSRDEVEALKDKPDLAVAQVGEVVLVHVADVPAVDQVAAAGGVSRQPRMFIKVLLPLRNYHDCDEVAALDAQRDLTQACTLICRCCTF